MQLAQGDTVVRATLQTRAVCLGLCILSSVADFTSWVTQLLYPCYSYQGGWITFFSLLFLFFLFFFWCPEFSLGTDIHQISTQFTNPAESSFIAKETAVT